MKKKILSIFAAAVIATAAFSPSVQQSFGCVSASAYAAVSNPTASVKSGTYCVTSSLKVKLSAQSGASIYYSTGGSYKKYTKALSITKNTTLKFYAIKNGTKSSVVTRSYKLCAKVTATPKAGEYTSEQTVKLTTPTSGVKLYYTTDGSKPTSSSKQYSAEGIKLGGDTKLRVLAKKTGWSSKYYTFEYSVGETVVKQESILDDYTKKYAYSTLSYTQKQIYAELFKTVSKHGEYADLSGMGATKADVDAAYWAFDYENPQFFWLANGYKISYSTYVLKLYPTYSRTAKEAAALQPKFEAAADKIAEEAAKQSSLFEQVKYLHDSIVDMTVYSKSGGVSKSEADGPLLNGKALCEGYAKAFMYLCQKSGIECICVSGYAGENHMWNMLKLEDEWYHMDVTWDDPQTSDRTQVLRYDYFCLDDKAISADHKPDNSFPTPKAKGVKYNYYEYTGNKKYSDVASAFKALVDKAAENYNNGIMYTEINADAAIMSALMTKVSSNIASELKAKGVRFSSYSYGYSGSVFHITLS
ncbi:MAG: chitobiase/beta-hexosaminidase C-terminal domain-containing protein [Oscillospiraceae bacterium]